MFVNWEIEHIPVDDSGNLDTANSSIIEDARDVMLMKKLGDNRDTFEFKISDKGRQLASKINTGDRFIFRRSLNTTTTTSDDIVMQGKVKSPDYQKNYSTDELSIEGYSYTDSVLNSIVFLDASNFRIPDMFKQAFKHVAEYSGGSFPVTWASSNPDTKSDGTDFPLVNEKIYNKPLRRVARKYSRADETGDGPYHYYVNTDNEFIWERSDLESKHTFDSSTDIYRNLEESSDEDDVVNFVIAKGGVDPTGQGIQDRHSDPVSTAEHDVRFDIIPEIARSANNLNSEDMNKLGYSSRALPKDSDYPFTTTWKSSTVDPEAKVTVSSDEEYVDVLRQHVKNECKEAARDLVNKRKDGTLQVEVTFTPEKDWQLGQVVSFTASEIFNETKKMRIVEIQLGTQEDKYVLEEDTGDLL